MNAIVLLLVLMGLGVVLAVGALVAFGVYSGVRQARESAASTTSAAPASPRRSAKLPSVERRVPHHPLTILDGCSQDDVRLLASGIDGAISIGAPLYNAGNFAGCYHMYEGTAADVERKLAESCVGPRRALEAGRTRAASLDEAGAQAWAMRDAFDGLVSVIEEREASH
jgi:serine protease Do